MVEVENCDLLVLELAPRFSGVSVFNRSLEHGKI